MAMSDTQEWSAIQKKFSAPPPLTAAFQALSIVGTNAYLAYLLFKGETSPVAIALYGATELVLWSAIVNSALIGVPKELRVGSPDVPFTTRIFAILLAGTLLFGMALITTPDREQVARLWQASDPVTALRELNILWPLLISAATAAFGSLGDRLRWRKTGGPFLNSLTMSATAKFATALVGPWAAGLASGGLADTLGASASIVWGVIYLVVKCGLELLMLGWQFRGLPDGKPTAK